MIWFSAANLASDMTDSSSISACYDNEIVVGEVVKLSEKLSRITAPNPGAMTGPGTNTYIVGVLAEGCDVVLVDPGPDIEQHITAIISAIEKARASLQAIIVTHTHRDHSPAALPIKQYFAKQGRDVPCLGMASDKASEKQFQDASFVADRTLRHADLLHYQGFELETIYTPGHVSNHLCFLLRGEQVLLAGDHMMQGSTVAIVPPQGDMLDYLDSLKLLKDYDINAIAPAHGTIMQDTEQQIDDVIAHRLWRENKILDKLPAGKAISTEQLLLLVYDDVAPELLWAAKFSLFAHLSKLLRESKVFCDTDLSGLTLETIEKLDKAMWQLSV